MENKVEGLRIPTPFGSESRMAMHALNALQTASADEKQTIMDGRQNK
jgi:hypothetical protein